MLVNCPKCGFSQPQDRYCANCGIDMDSFKPVQAPFWKKVLKNPALHIAFVLLLVIVSVLFIRQRQREEIKARVEFLKGGPLMVERSQRNSADIQLDASSEVQNQLAQEAAVAASAVSQSQVPTAEPISVESTTAAATSVVARRGESAVTPESAVVPKSTPTKVTVIYAEIDSSILSIWLEEMRVAGQLRNFDDVSMGGIKQISQKLKAVGVKELDRVELNILVPPGPVDWFVGTHRGPDPENEIGLFSSLVLSDSKDGLIRGEIEIQRAFRDPKDPSKTMERVSHGGPFELPPGSGFLMRGLIPRKFITELDEEAHADPVLSIFKSRAFRDGQTEFTILLEFDTTSSQAR